MFEKTKAFCDSFLEYGLPGFDLAVYQNGTCILRHMNGYSDLENKIPMNGQERYNLYSCSKVITCTAALQLWEKGLFSLEDKLADYLPEFQEMRVHTSHGIQTAQNPIRIRHLFEMTAGFSYNCNSPYIQKAITETNRRRSIQKEYNEKHGLVPKTIIKEIRDVIEIGAKEKNALSKHSSGEKKLTPLERARMIEQLTAEMKIAASKLEFEQAAYIRDRIKELRNQK